MCLKTSNFDYNGRQSMVSAAAANKKAFGVDRAANSWADILKAKVIWISGSNVGECSPILTNYIWQARENGARIIVVDPRITPIARTCDLFLPVKPGRDIALFNGILHLMIENDWLDHDFINKHTVGFGTLPGICYGWPKNELHWRGIDNSIVDIALTRTPELAIVDGIVGMEGDGPLNGTAKHMGILVMGSDLVAVDATCCRAMELDPERMGYLVLGHAKKLGRIKAEEIQQLGERIDAVAQPFETVPHLEGLRRKSA